MNVDHVNTQIPYAVLAGSIATILFLVSGTMGPPVVAVLAAGLALLVGSAYVLSEHFEVRLPAVFDSSARE